MSYFPLVPHFNLIRNLIKMSPSIKKTIVLVALFSFSGMLTASMLNPEPAAGANPALFDALALEQKLATSDELQPVDNMHHFMEYIYEPVFDHLKTGLENEPGDKAGWNQIKSSAMILAESSILLADRVPEDAGDKADAWKMSSKLVYQGGSGVYQAARKKDFASAKKHFADMINGCKQCHEKFRE